MTTKEIGTAIKAKEAAALAHGNGVLTELGFTTCDNITALSRDIDELKLGYEAAIRKLEGVRREIAYVRRLTAGEAQKHVVDMLKLHGPLWADQIARHVAASNPELSEDGVRSAIGRAVWFLDWYRSIIRGPDGWELIGDDPATLRRHWRTPRS